MSPLERFHAITQAPLNRWGDHFPGYRPLGVYNAYVPAELFHAAGLTPVYLFHQTGDRGQARAHLPGFACWPGRSLVDQALSGDLDGLAGMAFAQTCDTVQALTDIWRKVMPRAPAYHVGVPLHLAAEAARPYLIAELNHLRQRLGGFSDDALHQAVVTYNHTRALMGRLYERAAELRPTDLHAALRAALLMPKGEYNELLAELLNEGRLVDWELGNQSANPQSTNPQSPPRLILVGSHLADPALYQVIEESGGRVADDLLDVGHRHFAGPVATDGDPIAAVADHLLATLPTPTKHHPARRRDDYLIGLVARRQAHGVIFARQKFCDPHGFDYANVKPALDRARIPHLLIELEQASQAGQLRTRVEAFLEMISE
jgi:benzoyl-CoA reductase subunit C